MQQPSVITIDGPAGAGKSTLGALLAQEFGYLYFDTGVMYRALTLAALRSGIDLSHRASVEHLAKTIAIEVLPGPATTQQSTVRVAGDDVTDALRQPAVDRAVSLVAGYPGVRDEMVRQQRQIGQRGQVVMVGRDIGTIVMPDAELKIYLQASLDERARRRFASDAAHNPSTTLEQVQADIARRDAFDQHVMHPSADALFLDSDTRSPAEIIDDIVRYIRGAEPACDWTPKE